MNEYLKQYIELQKQFRETKGNPDSVRALYTFKEKLEQSEDKQAKEVLVDVYDLLDFKKDAYELLCQIGNRSDKKTLKQLGTLKEYAENWGNHYALPKPKTPQEKQKEKERQAQLGLPTFRYHPNPLETGAFEDAEARKAYYTEQMICEILMALEQNAVNMGMEYDDCQKAMGGDLSKAAKKEWYLRHKDRGMEP